jgi:DNA-binding LytR/AlgR family response regulator
MKGHLSVCAIPVKDQNGVPWLEDRLFIKDGGRFEKIILQDVLWLEARRNYCDIVTLYQRFTASATIHALYRQLPGTLLVRVHRSYVVNLAHVTAMEGSMVLIKEQQIPIGKNYRRGFLERFHFL